MPLPDLITGQCTALISSKLFAPLLISSHLISSHFYLHSLFVSSRLISSFLIQKPLISPHRTSLNSTKFICSSFSLMQAPLRCTTPSGTHFRRVRLGGCMELVDTLHRAPVGQGLLPPRPATAFWFWSLRALAKARRGRVCVSFIIIIYSWRKPPVP